MKLYVYQQPYAYSYKDAPESIDNAIKALDNLPADADIVLFPEYTNGPSSFPKGTAFPLAKKVNPRLLKAVKDAAKRCNAIVIMSYASEVAPNVWRNTTEVFDRKGKSAGSYYKQHLVKSEVTVKGIDNSYVPTTNRPAIVEVEGIRIGFLTCYDTYFPEFTCHIGALQPDLVCICSHQRAERPDILENQVRFTAFQCNAFVMRASVSMGKKANSGGNSMIASPDGKILARLSQETGFLSTEIKDIHEKYMRSNSFGGELISNTQFLEQGRTPWAYRPAGCGIVQDDEHMPYPRICAHRGFNTIAPESSLAAFGAAVAMGAQEIEFDVWKTTDGRYVVTHDAFLPRVSNGSGRVAEKSYKELLELDFGVKVGEQFRGLKVLTLEEVIERFQQRVIFNLHIKPEGTPQFNKKLILEIVDILDRYEVTKHTYIMTSSESVMAAALKYAPQLRRCMGVISMETHDTDHVKRALKYKCQKVQFYTPTLTQDLIDEARANGIICNLFFSDDVNEARKWLDRGIDTILTNDYFQVSKALN